MLARSLQITGDFRFDVLKRIIMSKQGWFDLSRLIQTYMNGHSHVYYVEILEDMLGRKLIHINEYELKRFKESYNGAFADFPLIAKINPAGIDEYRRVKVEKSDVENWKLKFIIYLVGGIVAVLTLFFTMAGKFHWLRL